MFHYSRQQIILHWVLVLLLVIQFLLGDSATEAFDHWLESGTKAPGFGANLHVILGIVILAIALWRLVLHVTQPKAPHGDGALDKLAVAVHWLLYVLLLATPVLGMLAWFGGSESMGDTHALAKSLLMILALLHVAGALYHHFILKDDVMQRMTGR
ncbi:cytochrome b [Paracoccus sp. (in: a-proteobacteria)]|uniref:cytochrome b n=1 Tax=Paracoccus sp. TaxID=267 RepID=UPI003A86C92C